MRWHIRHGNGDEKGELNRLQNGILNVIFVNIFPDPFFPGKPTLILVLRKSSELRDTESNFIDLVRNPTFV